MKAVRIHSFGGPEVLQLDQIADPKLKPAEVLVRVAAAGINPVDYKIRQGGYPRVTRDQLPITLGRDICGVIEKVSGSGSEHKVGDEVYALLDWSLGGYAEYVALPESNCASKPVGLSSVDSGAVPLAGLTAWQGIFDYGKLSEGQSILIHGGAGGVGHFAIQFAKARGAHVLTTASADDLEFVKQLGAEVAIDRKTQRFEQIAKDIDVVYDLIGGETRERSWGIIKRGGILVSTLGQPDEGRAAALGVRAAGYVAQPNRGQLIEIRQLINAGRVQPTVTKVFPLESAVEAHRCLEHDHPRGKIVFKVEP